MKRRDLETAIQALLDDHISNEDFNRLEAELLANPEARSTYKRYVRLSSALEMQHTSHSVIGDASVVPIDRVIDLQRKRTRNLSLAVAAAAILIIALLFQFYILPEQPAQQPTSFALSPGTEYQISQPNGYDGDRYTMVPGSQLILKQGCAKVIFASGVTSIVQAPADITLHSDKRIYMNQGKAWFQVSKEGKGFQVLTRELLITDLGTEFGVTTYPNALDEVHVFKGKVVVENLKGLQHKETLTVYESRRSDPGGRLSKIQNASFMTKLPTSLPFVHWSFDEIKDGYFHASGNHPELRFAKAKPPRFNIHDLQTSGRYGRAVRFDGIKGQQLHTQLPGIEGNAPRTTACWIRTNYIPHKSRGTDIAGLIGWGYCNDDGKKLPTNAIWKQVLVHPGVLAVSGSGSYKGNTQIADGKWHHVACVMRPPKKEGDPIDVTLYVDGEVEQNIRSYHYPKLPNTLTDHPLSTPVRIGCSIHKPSTPPIVFRGDIDEVYLFYGALDQAAIQNLMRNDHPLRTNQ